jgi:ABC-type phosphate transport system auxiliary subunit
VFTKRLAVPTSRFEDIVAFPETVRFEDTVAFPETTRSFPTTTLEVVTREVVGLVNRTVLGVAFPVLVTFSRENRV